MSPLRLPGFGGQAGFRFQDSGIRLRHCVINIAGVDDTAGQSDFESGRKISKRSVSKKDFGFDNAEDASEPNIRKSINLYIDR